MFSRKWLCAAIALHLASLFALNAQVTEAEKRKLFACDLFFRRADAVQHAALSPGLGSSGRSALKTSYDIDEATLDQLMIVSGRYTSAVAALDAEARTIIQTAKQAATRPPNGKGASVPPPPARLLALQEQKYQLLRDTIAAFTSAVGPAQAEYFLYNVTSKVSVQSALKGR